MGQQIAVAVQHIRNLCGSSQPILVEANDGLRYVVKFTNNLQGPNIPFNESVGSVLYRSCGLPVPAWKPLLITETFLDQHPACWMRTPEGALKPQAGMCFGSLYLGGEGVRLLEILPGTSFKRVRNHRSFWLAWLLDICAQHADNRQAIFQEGADGKFDAIFVDQGHFFGGPKGEQRLNFQASRYLDPRIYQVVSSSQLLKFQTVSENLDADLLWQRVNALPEEWKTASALESFTQCLHRLADARLLQNVLDTMVDAQQRTSAYECREYQNKRRPPMAVLCPGVPVERPGRRTVGKSLPHSACA